MYQAQQVGDAHNNNILEHHDHQSKMWTSLPGIIQSINMSHMTCTVQPFYYRIAFLLLHRHFQIPPMLQI